MGEKSEGENWAAEGEIKNGKNFGDFRFGAFREFYRTEGFG